MAINVLMLGWELPPWNSGGLGTACLGLTEGLSEHGVAINFVLPKTFGDTTYDHMSVVSAADYASDDVIKQLLARTDMSEEEIVRQLAYGAKLAVGEQQRLLVEHFQGHVPVSPHAQATWYATTAAKIAKKHPHFNVIHAHDWFTYYGGMAARKVAAADGRHTPFIAQIHATEYDRCGEHGDPRIIAIERAGLNAADRVVAVSHYTKEVVHKYYGVPRSKISVVYNGIPNKKQPKQFDLAEIKKHHKIVLFMGRLTMQKGPDYFVQLANEVHKHDPNVRFVMVGSGDMEKCMIEESAKLGLTGTILFSSFLRGSDVDRAYQLADVFVMPSVSEPFGIVALEAMQNGTPVIVSKQSGVAEVSNNIIKVDFWDVHNMAKSVLHVLHDPHAKHQLIAGGKNDLLNLTWTQAAQVMRDVYQDVIHSHKLSHA